MNENKQQNGNHQVHSATGEIVRAEQSEVDVLGIIERRNELLSRILNAAIRATHPGQWADFQGKPFPTAAAAEVMARRCGVKIYDVQTTKQESSDDVGAFYLYVTTATASLPGALDSLQAIGTCSSRDQFLGTETSAGRKLSEIDEGNILKASYSNMIVNAVTRLLGVRNMTWEQLGAHGIDRSGVPKIEYAQGSKGGGQKPGGTGIVLKYGPGKDKQIADQTDEHLVRYVEMITKELGDPEKAKFKNNNEKNLAAIKEEQARRANAKAGTTSPAASAAPTVYDRLWVLYRDAGFKDPERFKQLIKGSVPDKAFKDLVDADMAPVQAALEQMKAELEPGAGG